MTDMYDDIIGEQPHLPADFVYRDDRSRPDVLALSQPQDFAYAGRTGGVHALRRMAGDAVQAIAALRRPTTAPAAEDGGHAQPGIGNTRRRA